MPALWLRDPRPTQRRSHRGSTCSRNCIGHGSLPQLHRALESPRSRHTRSLAGRSIDFVRRDFFHKARLPIGYTERDHPITCEGNYSEGNLRGKAMNGYDCFGFPSGSTFSRSAPQHLIQPIKTIITSMIQTITCPNRAEYPFRGARSAVRRLSFIRVRPLALLHFRARAAKTRRRLSPSV